MRIRILVWIILISFLVLFPAKETVSRASENLTDITLERAQTAYQNGELHTASLFMHFLIEKQPEKTQNYLYLAEIYRKMGDFEAAWGILSTGLQNASETEEIKGELMRLEIITPGQKEKLIEEIPHSENRDYYFYRGLNYFQKHQWEKAIADLAKALESDPNLIAAYYFLGKAHINLENLSEAEEVLEEGLRRDRSFSGFHPLLGNLYYQRGAYQKAYSSYVRTPSNLRNEEIQDRIRKLQEMFPPPADPEIEFRDREVEFTPVDPVIDDNIPDLRVALLTRGVQVSFQAGSSFSIKDSTEQLLFSGDAKTTYHLKYTDGRFVLGDLKGDEKTQIHGEFHLKLEDKNTTLHIFDVEYGENYFWAGREDRQYRGSFIFQPRNNQHFYLINEVNIEEYLYSVIPSEMPASWPIEALKAQAIAARSYTLNRYYRNPNNNYHLVASVINAAYNGAGWEHSRARRAVDETRGLVATYGGNIIDAVYSSNSGGITVNSAHVWGGEVPYLEGTFLGDNSGATSLSFDFFRWIKNNPPSFSRPDNYGSQGNYRWTRVLMPQEPPVANRVGAIKEIIPENRGDSGYIQSVLIRGERGEEKISGDRIRNQLGGLKSNMFFVEPIFFNEETPAYFLIWGGGWGHGVGMDQTAAAEMAQAGYNSEEIIKTFYHSVDLENLY